MNRSFSSIQNEPYSVFFNPGHSSETSSADGSHDPTSKGPDRSSDDGLAGTLSLLVGHLQGLIKAPHSLFDIIGMETQDGLQSIDESLSKSIIHRLWFMASSKQLFALVHLVVDKEVHDDPEFCQIFIQRFLQRGLSRRRVGEGRSDQSMPVGDGLFEGWEGGGLTRGVDGRRVLLLPLLVLVRHGDEVLKWTIKTKG